MKFANITNKSGDSGMSMLICGREVVMKPKTSFIFEVLGKFDELNISLGDALAVNNPALSNDLQDYSSLCMEIVMFIENIHNNPNYIDEYCEKYQYLSKIQNAISYIEHRLRLDCDRLDSVSFEIKDWIRYGNDRHIVSSTLSAKWLELSPSYKTSVLSKSLLLDKAATVTRSVELIVLKFFKDKQISSDSNLYLVNNYLNRLSKFLFVAARRFEVDSILFSSKDIFEVLP